MTTDDQFFAGCRVRAGGSGANPINRLADALFHSPLLARQSGAYGSGGFGYSGLIGTLTRVLDGLGLEIVEKTDAD